MIFEKNQLLKLKIKMEKLEFPYKKLMFEPVLDLEPVRYDTKEHLRTVPTGVEWTPIQKGESWGGPFQSMWLKTRFTVPQEYKGRKLALLSEVGAYECLVFLDGEPSGLFNKHGNEQGGNHSIALISQDAEAGRSYDLALECYAGTPWLENHPYHQYGREEMPPEEYICTYNSLTVCAISEDVAKFYYDLRTLNQLVATLDENTARHGEVVAALVDVYKKVCQFPLHEDEDVWRAQMNDAQLVLDKVLAQKTGPAAGKVGIIGHSHMDTAWLWTVDETKRKCARTYANALSLMDWYPEYKFVQSSALHGAWMRDLYPTIFEGMKKRVAEGRYEPNGAVWVECDCNITGGEAMVRQFLWGQRFTMKEFGYKSDSFWLPDTFGYSAAIPQIMKGAGVKYFLTTKMEWGESNKFPYHSFTWKGLDGTPVLAHLNRIHVWPDAKTVIENYQGLKDKHVNPAKLVSYGFGDGGGGPQYQMLEMSKRINDLNGCPKAEHTTVSKFMQELEPMQKDLPVWNGELYLELHRGTLTMMHDMKRSNRFAEMALREYEALAVFTQQHGMGTIDKDMLNSWWEVVLKNQFHDILPGTCIPDVYDIAIPENYDVVDAVNAEASCLFGDMAKGENSITLFNSLNWERTGQVTLDIDGVLEDIISQKIVDVDGNEKVSAKVSIPSLGTKTYKLGKMSEACKSAFKYDGDTLETPFATVKFDDNGAITSFVDKKSGREIRREGGEPLNTFYLAEDVPCSWDNWDIDPDIDMKLHPHMHLLTREVVCDGALQFRIQCEYHIGRKTKLTQHMVFYSDTNRVDFETKIDWHEKHRLLKVGFDVDILSPTFRNEVQFGYLDRPTHMNTSWEAAKSEVCNHKWSDLSENRFGVAILNDCKYGISCKGSDMRLSLHKGGCRPDPRGDAGLHYMTYSLLPHDGGFETENVVRPSYELNVKPTVAMGEINAESLFTLDVPNVIVESIKPAEDSDGYVVRLYECERSAIHSTQLTFGKAPCEVYIANMLEEQEQKLEVNDRKVCLSFRPFEIKTLLIK